MSIVLYPWVPPAAQFLLDLLTPPQQLQKPPLVIPWGSLSPKLLNFTINIKSINWPLPYTPGMTMSCFPFIDLLKVMVIISLQQWSKSVLWGFSGMNPSWSSSICTWIKQQLPAGLLPGSSTPLAIPLEDSPRPPGHLFSVTTVLLTEEPTLSPWGFDDSTYHLLGRTWTWSSLCELKAQF